MKGQTFRHGPLNKEIIIMRHQIRIQTLFSRPGVESESLRFSSFLEDMGAAGSLSTL